MSDGLNFSEPDFSQSPDEPDVFEASAEHDAAMASISGLLPAYEIVGQIQRGGQGVIYKAIHKYTHRVVAIKVMTEGPFAGEMHRSRFKREAKMLARMKHPNIVAIHETGVAGGYHFFVMDYIEGRPLVEAMGLDERSTWAEGGAIDIRQLLGQFRKVCDAVNAAHLQGIIHRDLKPTNILVDGAGEPFVLDFGLAKHDSDNSEISLLTTTGQFLGSMPWASPEQVEAHPDKIDLRTDVYALGVILYQMLTGKFPYPVVGPTREVLNHIVHTEPTDPCRHNAAIDEEVQTIVMRCLQKDAARRYQTAGDLGRDIERYLAGEPIEAKRDSMSYMLRKRLYRYRVHMSIAALFCVVTLAGLVASLMLWRQAEEARVDAVAQREQAELVTSMMREMIATADPIQVKGADYTVQEMLDDFVPGIGERTEGMPVVEAKLRQTIGEAYLNMEDHAKALEQSELVLAAFDRSGSKETLGYAQALSDHAMSLSLLSEHDAAEAELREASALLGRLAPQSRPDILKTRLRLAQCLAAQGKHEEVDALLVAGDLLEGLSPSDRTEMEFKMLHAKADCYNLAERYEEARALLLEAAPRIEAYYGADHLELGWVYNSLGYVEKMLGNSYESFEYYKKTVDIKEPLYGEDNARLLLYKLSSANLLWREGGYSMAMHLVEDALRIRERYDLEIPLTSRDLINKFARLILESHLFEEHHGFAKVYWEYTILFYKYEPGVNDLVTAAIFRAIALDFEGETDGAQAFLREEMVKLEQGSPNDEISHYRMKNTLAYCMRSDGQVDDAERMMREATEFLFAHQESKLNAVLKPASIRAALFYRAVAREDEAKGWEMRFSERELKKKALGEVSKDRHLETIEETHAVMREVNATGDSETSGASIQVGGAAYTVHEMLDDFVPGLSERTEDVPIVEARLRQTIAEAYYNMEDDAAALEQSELALAAFVRAGHGESLEYAQILREHAIILFRMMRRDQTEAELREALVLMEGQSPPSHTDILNTRLWLAKCVAALGKFAEVDALLEPGDLLEGLEGKDRIEAEMSILRSKVYCFAKAERREEANELLVETTPHIEAHYGADHLMMAWVYHNLAVNAELAGDYAEARGYYEKTLEIKRPLFGVASSRILSYELDVAFLFVQEGDYASGVSQIEKTLRVHNEYDLKIPISYRRVINKVVGRAVENHTLEGAYGLARECWPYTIRWYQYEKGDVERTTGAVFRALSLDFNGETLEAQRFLRSQLVKLAERAPEDTIARLRLEHTLGYCMRSTDQLDEAERLVREASERLFTELVPDLWIANSVAKRNVEFYRSMNRDDEAQRWASRFVERSVEDDMVVGGVGNFVSSTVAAGESDQ